jgi:hypothetical protein
MASLNSFVPKVIDWLAAEDDGKDQGDAPSYHHNAGHNRDYCELSNRKDAMVEEQKRKLRCGNRSCEDDLGRPISLHQYSVVSLDLRL